MSPHLTIFETLMLLSAHFFLLEELSDEEKTFIVNAVIAELGLIKAKDTIIGDEKVILFILAMDMMYDMNKFMYVRFAVCLAGSGRERVWQCSSYNTCIYNICIHVLCMYVCICMYRSTICLNICICIARKREYSCSPSRYNRSVIFQLLTTTPIEPSTANGDA